MKTSELTGAQLDYWVAKAECLLGPTQRHFFKTYAIHEGACRAHSDAAAWQPSSDWAVGGPIIEREQIATWINGLWFAGYFPEGRPGTDEFSAEIRARHMSHGDTPLVAAMRAYVASRCGDEVSG